MKQKYILAIDGGTQSTKVVIFDFSGNEICSETVKLQEIHLYGDSRAEHPGDDLWESLQQACKVLFSKISIDPSAIAGVGLGSIRCCRALVKENGDLASPVQSWMDLRLSKPYIHEDDSVRYVTTSTGYLSFRLTGEAKDTRSNYVGPWPIDPVQLEWLTENEEFDAFHTPREILFELVDPSTVLGTITKTASEAIGIPVGTPVVSTANDKAVEALGAGLMDDGTVLISLGTYITSMMVGEKNVIETAHSWCNPGAVAGEILYESEGIRRGMATVSWVMDLFGTDIVNEAKKHNLTPEAYLNKLATKVPAGSNGLYTVLNWLARPSHPHERGIMIGFNGSHKGPHMFRSILEGIALTMKNNAQAMCDERDIKIKQLIISGGGSNGDLFMQIFADVFGVPAHRNKVNGSASLGAAICVSLALGIYSDKQEAINNMVSRRDTFHPHKDNIDLYRKINESVYTKIVPETNELLKRSHTIFSN